MADSVRSFSLSLTSTSHAAEQAREAVGSAVNEWGLSALQDDAELCASELASNAVRHARPPFELVGTRWGHCVRITLIDASLVDPEITEPDTTSETGWGLSIVQSVARRWGVEQLYAGKAVWFELGV